MGPAVLTTRLRQTVLGIQQVQRDRSALVLHDAQAEKSVVVILLDSEEDYAKADEILNAMPGGDTPGQRSSVKKYEVASRMSN